MTDLDIYQPGTAAGYQPGMIMTPEDARALDDQVRTCTEAVLREGTDYGIIPGTGGEKTLWRPGAQKLLQWFGLSFSCERVEIERDDQGRKHGITYRATVARRLPDGSLDIKATCEGTADYDESKFCQPAEEVQRKAEASERKWAKKDGRVADPTKWKNRGEYRADWNALMKRAQKRAIVGAVVDATAAGGIFTDREEDDHAPAPQDDGAAWYEQALEAAFTFTATTDHTAEEIGRQLYVDAARAARDGLCTPRQANHVQNRIRQRVEKLKTAVVVDVEDLGRQAAELNGETGYEDERPSDDEPGTVSKAQLTKLHTVLTGLGFGSEDREQKLRITEAITGRTLGDGDERSSKNLSLNEARKVIDTLDGMHRDQLIAYMAEQEGATDATP
jgi:hypothetical protein